MQAWATMYRSMTQVGLINVISQMEAGDPDLERRIVTEGFSYGRQLGRIIDALEVLVRLAKKTGLEPDDEKCLDRFSDMASKIIEIKVGTVPLSDTDLDDVVRRMETIKREQPRVRKQIARLQERLEAVDS
jgi:hypothetical protein